MGAFPSLLRVRLEGQEHYGGGVSALIAVSFLSRSSGQWVCLHHPEFTCPVCANSTPFPSGGSPGPSHTCLRKEPCPPGHAHPCWDTARVLERNGSRGLELQEGAAGAVAAAGTGRKSLPENRGGGAGTMEAAVDRAQVSEAAGT